MSRRSSTSDLIDEEIVANWEAEDRAFRALKPLPKEIAIIAAIQAAVFFVALWDMKKEELIRQGDDGDYYIVKQENRCWLARAVAKASNSSMWSHASIEPIRTSLADLPPDAAASVAVTVAVAVAFVEGFR